jgi:hypothetical protein
MNRQALCAGQVTAEYLVGCLVVIALMWIGGNGASLFTWMADAIREGFTRFAAALSIA